MSCKGIFYICRMNQRFPYLFFHESDIHGLGVFTGAPIPKDTLLEVCPVIVLSTEDKKLIHQTHLHDYYFLWGEHNAQCAIALGWGSLFNHSDTPNAIVELNQIEKTLDIYSLRDIEAGEEIFIDYNGGEDQENIVWFKPK